MTGPQTDHAQQDDQEWPHLSTIGTDGLLVRFADRLDGSANRAALAFRAAAEAAGLAGLEETSNALASVYLRFDPDRFTDPQTDAAPVAELLRTRDWYAEPLPAGRRLWTIPTVFGTELAPQLAEAAALAGLSPTAAIAAIAATRLRVQTIGFAPGQPYLGELPPNWDIPRQSSLTDRVPVGALTVAIRQLVLFSVETPTGWRHIGQTAFRAFRPDSHQPFVLRPGDEVCFTPVAAQDYAGLCAQGPDGGARSTVLT